jgi:hypothetical protein
MKKILAAIALFTVLHTDATPIPAAPQTAHIPAAPKQEFYSIRIYELKNADQEARVDKYLQAALLPALHRQGIADVGVFKPVGNDTAAVRRIYVLIPLKTPEQLIGLPSALNKDARYLADGADYISAPHDNPPYIRIESIFLQAFPDMPHHAAPGSLKGSPAGHIYELRSYEGPTEKYFENKVQMFNAGGEIPLFDRLGFHAVFYASVLSGSHMPNLMYMTSFEDMPSREQHWKDFGADSVWKKLVANPQYQHNVSHIDIVYLHPTPYSDL